MKKRFHYNVLFIVRGGYGSMSVDTRRPLWWPGYRRELNDIISKENPSAHVVATWFVGYYAHKPEGGA